MSITAFFEGHTQKKKEEKSLNLGIFCLYFVIYLYVVINFVFFFHISDEPEIDVEAEKVHSGLGKEAHLTCIVHGEPRPTVRYILNTLGTTVIIHGPVL